MPQLRFFILSAAIALAPSSLQGNERVEFLTAAAEQLLHGCRIQADDGTTLYTPDGRGNYRALWTRDFAYMVEYAGDLLPLSDIEACIRYLLKGQRDDGAMPDRVQSDGLAVYSGGPPGQPLGEPNLDNPPFMVILADEYLDRLSKSKARALFAEWAEQLKRGMNYIPLSERGLVYNPPEKPHSPYGFTDTIGKTGELFIESLLYWTACQRLAKWQRAIGNRAAAMEFERRARAIERNIGVLWDTKNKLFFAATQDCRQIDVWGNAYAVYIDFPLREKRKEIVRWFAANRDRYAWHGQIRHLPKGEYWSRLLMPVAQDRYQNGAYWAAATGWVMWCLAQTDRQAANEMFSDLIDDFRAAGIYECIGPDYRQLDTYVVSATNPLHAARKLGKVKSAK